jgi:hypothetical protein
MNWHRRSSIGTNSKSMHVLYFVDRSFNCTETMIMTTVQCSAQIRYILMPGAATRRPLAMTRFQASSISRRRRGA